MRRVTMMLGSAVILLAGGCGLNSYERRLTETLERMKYEAHLNENLLPPATKGKWTEFNVYLRPPKNWQESQEFQLTAPEPGKFDIEASFLEDQKQLHVLVRRKLVKTAAKKKTPSPADTADRTNFVRDVFNVLASSSVPSDELVSTKFKSATEKTNEYKSSTIVVEDKVYKVYLYKRDPYEAALIFQYPKDDRTLAGKIRLCLESFAVGDRAKNAFSGVGGDEEGGGAPGTGGTAVPVF